ncbi:MAG: bifunctional folylpolyglutamate synthase/dihydrofolate synthase [Lachnospiraceae bacterium]|nr:bifunctional folylpolyglutamate synthase/dihydrofolate synthase [Lachnospiraceae bacterium]
MDYPSAISYIEEKNKLGITPGLDNIKELLNRLGNPQDSCKCLHIGGTNGKGSIFAFLQDILMEAGMKVGRYVSPTIMTYLERFQINKIDMLEERFASYIYKVEESVSAMMEEGFSSPSAFEIETAVAFMYFKDEDVDVALIECGMGGKLDATNVMTRPLASVFASISMDHMTFLGDTLEEIAENKSHIIKEGSVCVAHPQSDRVSKVLKNRCEQVGASYIEVDEADVDVVSEAVTGSVFKYKNKEYSISLPGTFQIGNVCTAIEIAHKVFQLEDDIIARAIRSTNWLGRFTVVNHEPLTVIDGAHNEKAWSVLNSSINKYFTNRQIIYIIGVLKDKEYDKMVDILKDTMSYAIAITPNTPRGLDKDILSDLLLVNGVPATTAESAKEAVSMAYGMAEPDDVVMICGSLSFLAEYINYDYSKHKE